MIEKIGKVTMNYDYYKGKDLYSDGDIENVILDMVQESDVTVIQIKGLITGRFYII